MVTKSFPASDVRLLADLGVTDVGENRHQEAAGQGAPSCADLDLRWHFVGGLQSNKAAAVAAYADVVHSVDRVKLVRPLDPARTSARTASTCCCRSASTRPTPSGRAGADPADLAGWPRPSRRPGCSGSAA